MGNGASIASSNMETFVAREFDRVRADPERDYLVLPEMIQLRSVEQLPIDFNDLGMLFCLDSNHDGMVTLPELTAFMLLCSRQSREYKAYEFQHRMAAFAAEELWRSGIRAPAASAAGAGKDDGSSMPVVAWVAALVRHCSDSDLDLSTSLDASIDLMAMAAAAQRLRPVKHAQAPGRPTDEADEVGVSDDEDVDDASEEVLGTLPARIATLSIPRLNLGGRASDTRPAAVPGLSLTGVARKGEVPATAAATTDSWAERSPAPAAPPLPIIPGELVGMDTVKLLFDLLHVTDVTGIGFQEFVDLLQQVADESGTLDLEDESFDNVVPINVILQFVRDFAGALDGWMVGYTGKGDAEGQSERNS